MARQLPFEVAPTQRYHQIGDEQRGILKLRQRNSVSVPERLAVDEVDRSEQLFKALADFVVMVHREAKPPSQLAGRELHEVYLAAAGALEAMRASVTPPLGPLEAELALGYTDEMQALARDRSANIEALILRQATTMIRTRLTGCQDWTDDDTRVLDSEQMIVQIALFYRDEASGGADGQVLGAAEQLKELQEALGKLQLEHGDPPPNPTGDASTGDAEPPTQLPPSLAPISSEPSPSPTSSTPSTRRRSASARGSTTRS